MGCASSSAADNEGHAPGSSRRGSARTESVPEEPWESTVKSGEGWPVVSEEHTVRKSMRFSLDGVPLLDFSREQASAKDEYAKLQLYLERGKALAVARGAIAGCPLRGSANWLDSDASEATAASFGCESLGVQCATVAGTRGGGLRPNQDAFGVAFGVAHPELLLTSVFDGHGPQGHFIARHVRDRLPSWIAACYHTVDDPEMSPGRSASTHPAVPSWVLRAGATYSLNQEGQLSRVTAGGGLGAGVPSVAPEWAHAVSRAFIELDGDLCTCRSTLLSASRVSPEQSGTTAVSCLVGQGHLLVAGCGDSAAFLAVRARAPQDAPDDAPAEHLAHRPRYHARCMSVLHKPVGEEAVRMRLAGGRVAAHPGEEHIVRVWPREQDVRAGSPAFGLAVARAFGDTHWKRAGVCAAPDITLHKLGPDDAFILLCSDGVTDVMTGREAVSLAADALHEGGEPRNAAQAVNAAAKAAWLRRFPRHGRDDITTAIVLLRAGEGVEGTPA